MVVNALFAALHFLAAFGVVATLLIEWLLFKPQLSYVEARILQKVDLWYGITAGTVLVVGFLRVFYFEKGSDFYFASPLFHVKLTLFIVTGLLSIYPTVKFLGWSKYTRQQQAPMMTQNESERIRLILNIEFGLLVGVIVAASLMAKGIGM